MAVIGVRERDLNGKVKIALASGKEEDELIVPKSPEEPDADQESAPHSLVQLARNGHKHINYISI